RPFNLAVAPLWRVLWVELADDDQLLVVTFHHSIIDEWSVRIFCRELSSLYPSGGDLQSASLPDLPIQFADYYVWQRALQATDEWEQSLVYWKEQLAELPPALELPVDKVRPIQPSGQGAIYEFRLNAPLTRQLRQLARDESVTLFTMMLAVFNVWLARHTGQTDIIVGTPLADRDRPEVQSLMGYFLNTLPIRTRLEENPRFRRVIRQIHQTLLDAYSHAEIPFERLVELSVKERELGRHPIYQVMFVFLEESVENLQFGDAIGRLISLHTETSKNDLTLDIQANGDEWVCRMEYATDLFSQTLIERFAAHFQSLLKEISTSPEASIQQLPLLTESETKQFLKDWNQTSINFPNVQSIQDLFESQVQLTPEKDAIVFHDSRMSYRQLNERANALANRLISFGAKPDILIGLFADRSLETLVGLLGILKAGAAYVPLDPSYPEARLRSIIEDARIEIIVTQEHLSDQLTEGNFRRVLLNSSVSIDMSASENPPPVAGPSHLAYVLYTSGSTGRPKGVAMEHRALTNLIQWQIGQYPSGEQFRTLQFASLGFDVSFQEIFSTWCSGGTLILIDENTRRDMSLFFKFIESEQVERIFVPFVVLQQFIEASEDLAQKTVSLREIVTAGEQLRITPQLVRFFENNPGCRLVNQYGPTEAHVVTSYTLEGPPLDWPLLPPIGRPIANIQVYVLSPHLQPLPIGMPGELYLGGVGVARGYLNQPELTAEKFLPDSFTNKAGSKLYRTGDKVRWNSDGQLEFLGRIDQQVKFRGYRIELGEIEATLNQAPSVGQTLVMLRKDHPGDRRLVAYVVPTSPTTIPSPDDLRLFLQSQLPEYMIPSIFVALSNLPLTVNGKVDRKALPVPNYEISSKRHRQIAPRTPLEQLLADAWKDVLGIERISIDDHFFELGGHSLLAMRLASIVGKQLNREVLVKWVFENPTVEQLAKKLTEITGVNRQLQSIPLIDRSQPLPLSFGQHSMWLVQALLPDTATYHQPIAIRLTGRIDRAVVDQAIEQIARRHESLRTAFVQSGKTLVQHICKPAEFVVNRREISLHLPTTEQQHQTLQTTLLDEVRQPFDWPWHRCGESFGLSWQKRTTYWPS
ncbi:MAG: amino acid adenylation domain-containing protein, partial [Schlesneria sp.]